jgi:anti-sigma B factor antagonist
VRMSDTGVRLDITRTDAGLVLVGEIDAHTAPDLAAHLDPLPAGDGDAVLDVAGIEFIDSSGLRVLIEAHQRAVAAGRRLVIQRPSASVRRLFEISGLAGHLLVDDSPADDSSAGDSSADGGPNEGSHASS